MLHASPTTKLSGLPFRLVRDDLLSEQQALSALEESAKRQVSFVEHLVTNKLLGSRELAISASQEFGAPLFDLDALDLEVAPISLVEEKLMRKHHVLPLFKRGNRLYLGISDPTNHTALNEIRFHTGLFTISVLVEEDKLTAYIEKAIRANDTTMSDLLETDLQSLDLSLEGEEGTEKEADSEVDDTPLVRFVHKIFLDAINHGASDIHFEPYEKLYRIRFRQDGMLIEWASPPINIANRIASRIKVMSRMNIAERRVPQDGRIKMVISKHRSVDFRVNTCPTVYGEKIVLRILDPSVSQYGIERLGFEPFQMQQFLSAVSKPYGLILVTGPTGSGKTVTLYSALNLINKPEINISTVEDPVEIPVPGINQVNMNPKTGLTFAEALRAFLRQDPDVIMVGEIRDLETAEISVKAAQTGHLVFSTLHTNDAPQVLTRLANMGVPPFNIASSILLIIAQRLVRRLCEHCKTPEDIPRAALLEEGFKEEELDDLTLYKAVGCKRCTNGYKGRIGIYQVISISEALGRLIMEGGNSMQLAEQAAKEGALNLRQAGLLKVKAGITSLEEMNRVTTD
jgi:type IV pilus assembly protein PilB